MIVLANKYSKNQLKRAQLILGSLFLLISCSRSYNSYVFSGNTMGTTYSVKLVFKHTNHDNIRIKNSIDSILFNLNQQMSTYIKESEISLFNENLSTEPQKISDDFFYVLEQGKIINQKHLSGSISSKPKIFLMHGANDIIVPPTHLLEAKEYLKKHDINIKTKMFKNCEHKIPVEGSSLGLAFLKKNLL